MVLSEELGFIERVGIGAFAFVLVYALLKIMIARNFVLADRVMALAEDTIKENSAALLLMKEALLDHIQQKDTIVEAIHNQTTTITSKMQDCKANRDKQLREIFKKQ